MSSLFTSVFSCVYKCVCKQFSERLYNDLLSCIAEHLESLNDKIKRNVSLCDTICPKDYIFKTLDSSV